MKKNSIFKKIKNFILPTTNHSLKTKRGFTLIEILVVVSIIGVITAITLVSLNGAKKKATDVKSVTELDQLRKAIELYRTDMGKYPGGENKNYNFLGDNSDSNNGLGCLSPAYEWFDSSIVPPVSRCTSLPGSVCELRPDRCSGLNVPLTDKKTTYGGNASDLFLTELVPKYISAVPFYVVEYNDFEYLTGTQAKKNQCGAVSYSGYLIIFKSSNRDLKMSKISDRPQNCEVGENCYYCLGY